MVVPILESLVGTPQPSLQFMQKQKSIFSSQKFGNHVCSTSMWILDVGGLQHGDEVFDQKLNSRVFGLQEGERQRKIQTHDSVWADIGSQHGAVHR